MMILVMYGIRQYTLVTGVSDNRNDASVLAANLSMMPGVSETVLQEYSGARAVTYKDGMITSML